MNKIYVNEYDYEDGIGLTLHMDDTELISIYNQILEIWRTKSLEYWEKTSKGVK